MALREIDPANISREDADLIKSGALRLVWALKSTKRGPGRKSMGQAERAAVSVRMMRYWENRRKQRGKTSQGN